MSGLGEQIAIYPYTDEHGGLLHEVIRYAPKTFRQRHIDASGTLQWGLNGTRRVPYELPAVRSAAVDHRTVIVVEGEKDADALTAAGFVATTNCGGAPWQWTPEFTQHFAGVPRVVIIPDADAVGRKAAQQRAEILARVVGDVRICELAPDRSDKTDVSDWLAAGNTPDQLRVLIDAAPRFEPKKTIEPVSNEQHDFAARIQSAASLAGTAADEILWDIERLLPSDDAPTLVFGPPGSLKSWTALHLCDAVVAGRSFLGRFNVRKRRVALYVNLDAGPKSLRNRIRRVSDSVAFDFITMSTAEFSLIKLRRLMEHYRGGFIVLDCLAAIFAPDRTADPAFAMREWVDGLRGLFTEFDCGGLIIDHPHRPKEKGENGDYYGNIQKEAAFRSMWGIVAEPPVSGEPRSIKISCRKLSEGEPFATVNALVDFTDTIVGFSAPDADLVMRPSAIEARIIEWASLRTDSFSKRTVADSIRGYRVVDVRAAVENLIESGKIVPTGIKRGGGDLYRLECVPQCVPDQCVPIENRDGTHWSDLARTVSESAESGCVPDPDAPYETGKTVFD